MTEDKKSVFRIAADLAGALAPWRTRRPGYQLHIDPPGEVQKQEQIKIEDTEPLEKAVTLGPRFPSEDAIQVISDLAQGLRECRLRGMRANTTFHLDSDGYHIDVSVSKPYRIRQYNGGVIVKVYDERVRQDGEWSLDTFRGQT